MRIAASDFLIPTIEIIKPRLVVCFGLNFFNAVRQVLGFNCVVNIQQAVHSYLIIGSTIIFCQAHTGMLCQNNRNRGFFLAFPLNTSRYAAWNCCISVNLPMVKRRKKQHQSNKPLIILAI